MPIHMRLPKRGFNVPNPKKYNELNLGRIQTAIDAGKLDVSKPLTEAVLVEAGVVRRAAKDGLRLLAKGDLTTKVSFEVAGVSKSALEAVEKVGGSVTVLAAKSEAAE